MNINTAKILAESYISRNIDNPENDSFQIVESAVKEDLSGWYFPFQTKRFIETRDIQFSVVGNCPVFVSKDGLIVEQRRTIL